MFLFDEQRQRESQGLWQRQAEEELVPGGPRRRPEGSFVGARAPDAAASQARSALGAQYAEGAAPQAAPAEKPGFFSRMWQGAKGMASSAWQGMKGLGSSLLGSVSNAFGGARKEPAASPAGWAMRDKNRDVTESYHELVAKAHAGENTLPEDAANYVYLNVPGLFTERYPGYMSENAERMSELGLDPRTVPIDTDAGVEANAKVIRDMIMKIAEEEERQVVLTGQSKGGTDISAALGMYPELKEHVRAVVSMQAPYGGTHVSSDVEGGPLRGVADGMIKNMFRGDTRSLGDLAYDKRQEFVGKHPYPEDVPTVSLATSTQNPLSPVGIGQKYMQGRYGLESDGLVPVRDQILPGSDVVRLNNMDHAGSVMRLPGRGNADTPADLTQALLTLALRKAAEKDRREEP